MTQNQQLEAEAGLATADAAGAAQPPIGQVKVELSDKPQQICPMTGRDCVDHPDFPMQCKQPDAAVQGRRVSVGRTSCFRWLKQVQNEELQRRREKDA